MSESLPPTIHITTSYDPGYADGAEMARRDDDVAAQVEDNDA